jgi:hypothetical protein
MRTLWRILVVVKDYEGRKSCHGRVCCVLSILLIIGKTIVPHERTESYEYTLSIGKTFLK